MLSTLFKSQLIPYQLIPVVGYSDLKSHYSKLDEDVTNVILVGCGAMIDLESFFEVSEGDRKIFVIDGHRPWNLDNVFGSETVVCFDDGYINENLKEEKNAYEGLLRESEENEEIDENEEESDTKKNDENDENAEDTDGEEIENEIDNPKKRKIDVSDYEDKLEAYYSQGAAVITAVTAQIYSMISSLGENEYINEFLWLSIIGATSLDYSYPLVYKRLYPLLRDEVTRISPGDLKKPSESRIAIDKDYHLFLVRHWTLYNSFLYSNYVNSKLYLWQEEGRKKLNKMFAKMGISLQVANQNWLYMDIEIKKKLNMIFKKYLGLYDLEDIVDEGFIRHYGYKNCISAREFVESLVALLQHDEGEEDKENVEEEEDNLLQLHEEEITQKLEMKEKKWVKNFWNCWDSLSSSKIVENDIKKIDGIDIISKGLDIAKEYQQTIFKTGVMIMEKKLLKSLRVFRLVVLKDESIPNLGFYTNPLNLTKLGQWILESLAELDNVSLLPLVLASLDVRTDTYLVVGMSPVYPRNRQLEPGRKRRKKDEDGVDKVLLNTFSVAFHQVSSTTGAKVRIDSFESSVIEIRKEDLSPFLEKLTLCGLV